MNSHTHICSRHFVEAEGRRSYPEEVPSLCLPLVATSKSQSRKPPKGRTEPSKEDHPGDFVPLDACICDTKIDASSQTDQNLTDVAVLKNRVLDLEAKLQEIEMLELSKFSIHNIKTDNALVTLYTGFPSFQNLEAFYAFLGHAVDNLKYSKKRVESDKESCAENKHL